MLFVVHEELLLFRLLLVFVVVVAVVTCVYLTSARLYQLLNRHSPVRTQMLKNGETRTDLILGNT